MTASQYEKAYNSSNFWTWFVAYKDPHGTWEEHPTMLGYEIEFFIVSFITLLHALSTGGRYPYYWLATVFHGLFVENVIYNMPDIDNFWHTQSTITLLGQRLPLQVVWLYPLFLYTAYVSVSQLRLPYWIEPWTVGAFTVLMDIPYDIMGIKLVWWTWHDTDTNIYDRFYWVPWTSFYFHCTFAASVTFWFNGLRYLIGGRSRHDGKTASFPKELLVCVLTGVLGMLGGVLQFMPVYHPLHDYCKVPTEVIVVILIASILIVTWAVDRNNQKNRIRPEQRRKDKLYLIYLGVLIHYIFYFFLVVFAKPENIKTTGIFELVGPCNETVKTMSPIGQELTKRRYLCPTDYNEDYFDWHCRENQAPPPDGSRWYTICGTPFPNHAEYIFVVQALCVFAMFAYYQLLFRSADNNKGAVTTSNKKKTK